MKHIFSLGNIILRYSICFIIMIINQLWAISLPHYSTNFFLYKPTKIPKIFLQWFSFCAIIFFTTPAIRPSCIVNNTLYYIWASGALRISQRWRTARKIHDGWILNYVPVRPMTSSFSASLHRASTAHNIFAAKLP